MRARLLHFGLIAGLAGLCFVLPAYHLGAMARILVLATFAMGYNVLFGYGGLLSLGHAMFFAAGMYGLGLSMVHGGVPVAAAFVLGVLAAGVLAAAVAVLALRTAGVAFMIVTLMFAQVGYLVILWAGTWTRGDEGFVLAQEIRQIGGLDLSDPMVRYLAAWILFSAVLLAVGALMRARFGQVLIGIRENEERTTMLGYDVWAHKFAAVVVSGVIAGAAGAAYGLLFGYVGASFAGVQYSIFPLLWVLLGGAGTTVGPLVGAVFMFYLQDYSSGLTSAYLLIVGVVLVVLILFARTGIMGEVRRRWAPWLP